VERAFGDCRGPSTSSGPRNDEKTKIKPPAVPGAKRTDKTPAAHASKNEILVRDKRAAGVNDIDRFITGAAL